MPNALVSGITGQDGAYLAELLLSKGYKVFGIKRRSSTESLWRLETLGVADQISYIDGDVTDRGSIERAVSEAMPDEVYNLAAQSFVPCSFRNPVLTFDVNAVGTLNILETLRGTNVRFYQASTSEMFGDVDSDHQNEETKFQPRSPYAVSKAAAHYATINYREAYGLQASCGILFNHESPLRGDEFVTQKIIKGVKAIVARETDRLNIGNTSSFRDWGHARDYVRAMWLMLQSDPDDYVVATGEAHSVKEFADRAFDYYGLEAEDFLHKDPEFVRPSDVPYLRGDPSKIKRELGWIPEYNYDDLILDMIGDVTDHRRFAVH